MDLSFKQVIDGLVHTTTVTDVDGYISVKPWNKELVYGGLNITSLRWVQLDTGVPMHFESNFRQHVTQNNFKGAATYCPEITEEQWLYLQLTPEDESKFRGEVLKVLDTARASWASKLAHLQAIPDGTYWLTEEPIPVDWIEIDGERIPCQFNGNEIITGDAEYIAFTSHEEAGEVARQRWVDMCKWDESEFIEMVGANNLLAWGLGNLAGPGTAKVSSLEDWFDLYLDHPEEELAGYDGKELEVTCSQGGFTVAYRTN